MQIYASRLVVIIEDSLLTFDKPILFLFKNK